MRSGRAPPLRRPSFALSVLSIVLLLLAARVWWSPEERRGLERKHALPPRDPERAGLRTLTGAQPQRVPAGARQTVVVPAEEPVVVVAPNPTPSLVRVVGHIRRAGRPLAGCDLTFRSLEQGRERKEGDWAFTDWDFTDWAFTDWDFTDEDGRYEVELPAARYAVRSEDGGLVAEVLVPEGRKSFDLDLDVRH